MKRKLRLGFPVPAAAAAGFLGLLLWPAEAAQAAGSAVQMCLSRLLPAVFPYLVLSGVVVGMGWIRAAQRVFAPVMRRLFGLPGVCAEPFLLGLVGGYPVGARSAMALYAAGRCTKREAERLLAFCNCSGPAFLLGAVGAGLFGDRRAGLVFLAVHALAAVCTGMIFRLFFSSGKIREDPPAGYCAPAPRFSAVFASAVSGAVRACAAICGFVLFFAVVSALLDACGLLPALISFLSGRFSLPPKNVRAFLLGSLELTAGLDALHAGAGSVGARMCLAAFLLGWGGFSVHGQTLALREDDSLSLRPYLPGKLTHGLISALLMRLFLTLTGFPIRTSAFEAELSPHLFLLLPAAAAAICFFAKKRV